MKIYWLKRIIIYDRISILGHVASTATEMVGCTIVPDIANDAFIVNIQNTVMDNKTVQNVDLRERSTVPHVTYEYSSRIHEWKN